MANRWGSNGNSERFIFLGFKITADDDCSHEIKRHLLLGRTAMTNLDSILKSRDKGPSGQSYGFSSSYVWMWELDCEEGWALKNWCFWTVVLQKTLDSLLDCKESQPVHPKGNQPWIFIGRNDDEAPVFWSPDAKNWLLRKDPDAEKDWRQEEKGTTEDEMVGWHHWLSGHEFEQAPGDGEGHDWATRQQQIISIHRSLLCLTFAEDKVYSFFSIGLPLWLSCKRVHLPCGRPGFNPWIGKIPCRRERLSTPVFWPGEFHGLYHRINVHMKSLQVKSVVNILIIQP